MMLINRYTIQNTKSQVFNMHPASDVRYERSSQRWPMNRAIVENVISRLNTELRTPSSVEKAIELSDRWVPKTTNNPTEATSQKITLNCELAGNRVAHKYIL